MPGCRAAAAPLLCLTLCPKLQLCISIVPRPVCAATRGPAVRCCALRCGGGSSCRRATAASSSCASSRQSSWPLQQARGAWLAKGMPGIYRGPLPIGACSTLPLTPQLRMPLRCRTTTWGQGPQGGPLDSGLCSLEVRAVPADSRIRPSALASPRDAVPADREGQPGRRAAVHGGGVPHRFQPDGGRLLCFIRPPPAPAGLLQAEVGRAGRAGRRVLGLGALPWARQQQHVCRQGRGAYRHCLLHGAGPCLLPRLWVCVCSVEHTRK